jgi:hypothetical protein
METATSTKKIHGHGNFIPGAVRIVDYDTTTNNVLVRGSSAFGAADFVIGDLVTAIQQDVNYSDLTAAGITIGSNPLVIDFCLIGFAPDSKDNRIVDAETTWFVTETPSLNGLSGPYPVYIPSTISGNNGVMVFWPVQAIGGTAPAGAGQPWQVSPENSIGSGTTEFDFSGLIRAVRAALTNTNTGLSAQLPSGTSLENAIIYFHCDSGVNRTGAVATAYLMCYGSNVGAFNLAGKPSVPYTLAAAQNAANEAPPSNNPPEGGCDIPVTEAYCNYLATKQYDADLVAQCVPLTGTPGTGDTN